MRIFAGSLRGRVIEVPQGIRPTGGRSKEALFSRWQTSIEGSLFLDLFAGSGAIGMEALSRGAREAVFVDSDPRALRTIRANCRVLASSGARIVRGRLPVLPAAVSACAPFDLVFADPPYDFAPYEELLARLPGLLGPDGEAAIEHSSRVALSQVPDGLVPMGVRDYGESRLSFFRIEAASADSR